MGDTPSALSATTSAALARAVGARPLYLPSALAFTRGETSEGTPADVKPARDGLAKLFSLEHEEVDVWLNENLRALLS